MPDPPGPRRGGHPGPRYRPWRGRPGLAILGVCAATACVLPAGQGGEPAGSPSPDAGLAGSPASPAPAASTPGPAASPALRQIQGRIVGPAGVLSGGARFRVAEATVSGTALVRQAIVYLIRQDDTLLSRDGKVVLALTDADGRYSFPDVPAEPLMVAVVLPGNKRLAGLVRPLPGENRLDVDVATTYVAAFLRDRARAAGKTLDAYPLEALPRLADLTRLRLGTGELTATPDLEVNAAPALARGYAVFVASRDPVLCDDWAKLLGHRTPAVQTLSPPTLPEGRVYAVAVAPDGTVVAGEFTSNLAQVVAIRPGRPAETVLRDNRLKLQLYTPSALAFLPDGRLFLGDSSTGLVRKLDLAGLRSTDPGDLPALGDWSIGPGEFPVIPQGIFREQFPGALTFSPRRPAVAPDGTLFVADGLNHRVVAISPAGQARRVAGVAPGSDFDSDSLAGFSGDGGPATQAALATPNGVTWRSEGGGGAIYIADTGNHRIRRVDLASGTISTVAGSGPGYSSSLPAAGAFGGDGGPALQARLDLPFRVGFTPDGAMLIADSGNQRIRIVEQGGISTLAGTDAGAAGATARDGPAAQTVLGEVVDLAVDASGDVVFAANDRGVRKLWLRHGR